MMDGNSLSMSTADGIDKAPRVMVSEENPNPLALGDDFGLASVHGAAVCAVPVGERSNSAVFRRGFTVLEAVGAIDL